MLWIPVIPTTISAEMHGLWAIPELTQAIVEALDSDHQLEILPVCHLMFEASVPLVWESIDLIRLQDLYDIESKSLQYKASLSSGLPASISPNRPLTQAAKDKSQHARFDLYTRAVKSCMYNYKKPPRQAVLHRFILNHSPITTLLPNVRSIDLRLYAGQMSPPPEILSVLGPSIQDFSFGGWDLDYLKPLNEILGTTGARLRSLGLMAVNLLEKRDVDMLVDSQTNLRDLTILCKSIDFNNGWTAVSRLPHLESVAFSTTRQLDPPVDPSIAGFPALVKVDLELSTSTDISSALSTITSPYLKEIKLGCDSGNALQVALQHASRLNSCTNIFIQRTNMETHSNEPEPPRACPHLTRLEFQKFEWPCTDEFIKWLVQALPGLQELKIPNLVGVGLSRSGVTLLGLEQLVRSCPKLEILSLSIDARGNVPKIPVVQGSSLKVLNLQKSLAGDDINGLASFLAKLWPGHHSRSVDVWDPLQTDNASKWRTVFELVGKELDGIRTK